MQESQKMANISILIALLLYLLCTRTTIWIQGQLSHCSEYFTYIAEPEIWRPDGNMGLLGQIEIPIIAENEEFHLKVGLTVASESSKKFIRLELARSIKESVRAVQQGNSLLYYIYFKSQIAEPIPTLTAIWFNDRQYCPGPASKGRIIATIVVGHVVYPLNEEPLSWRRNSSHYNISNPTHHYLNYLSNSKPPQPITATVSYANNECGITNYYPNDLNNRIPNGEKTFPGQWPWVVAIFVATANGYEFLCSGTVLTTRHILTAAQCTKFNYYTNDTIDADNVFVAFGTSNAFQWRERGTIIREVASYKVHPEFMHTRTADSDLAIYILRTNVDYSPFIKPICLWFGPTNLQNVINGRGYVIGWGHNRYSNNNVGQSTDEPRIARMSIENQEHCLSSDERFVDFISNRTFCASLRNENDLCNADTGSGLMLYDSLSNRYHLRGIVSRTVIDNRTRKCRLGYFVFVDVAQYIPWIRQQILTT